MVGARRQEHLRTSMHSKLYEEKEIRLKQIAEKEVRCPNCAPRRGTALGHIHTSQCRMSPLSASCLTCIWFWREQERVKKERVERLEREKREIEACRNEIARQARLEMTPPCPP